MKKLCSLMIFTALQPSPVSPSLPFLMILGEEEKEKKKKTHQE